MPSIDSPEEAQSVARLIQQGQITGGARDTAMQALRDFDTNHSAGTADAQPPGDATGSLLRKIALGGRSIGEGVLDTLALPHDLGIGLQNLMRRGANAVLGTNLQPQPTWAQGLSDSLTASGAPVPQTKGEQYGTAITRGVSGALTGGGILGLASPTAATVPNAVRAGVSGVTGSAAAEGARQAGAPGWAQFAAGLAGGLTPAGIEGTGRLATTVGASIARPLTRSGQQQMAANILARRATNPQAAAANLANATDLVPGSARTTGEASQDVGLLALEKGVRGVNPAPFGERISQQNAARQAQLATLAGAPGDVRAAQAARDAATGPMRDAALGNTTGATIGAPTGIVHDTIDQILASPAGSRETVSRTLQWARDLIGNETDPAALYEIRKDLQLAQTGKLQPSSPNAPNASTLSQARGQLGQVVNSLDNAIDWAAPGFKAYLQRYRDMSVPIDAQKAIQEIQRRAQTSSLDVTTGQPFLGASKFGQALDQSIQRVGSRLTPDQAQQLHAIRTDLQLGQALNSPLVRAPGSDTFQNLSLAQVFGAGMTDTHPAIRVLTKPLNWIYQAAGSNQAVTNVLTDAMLNPKIAAQLLQRATPGSVQSLSNSFRSAVSNAFSTALPGRGMPAMVPLLTSPGAMPTLPPPSRRLASQRPASGGLFASPADVPVPGTTAGLFGQ